MINSILNRSRHVIILRAARHEGQTRRAFGCPTSGRTANWVGLVCPRRKAPEAALYSSTRRFRQRSEWGKIAPPKAHQTPDDFPRPPAYRIMISSILNF